MKQISSRFSMAVHILSMITMDPLYSTGDRIARSINSNPVVIRRIMAQLKKAGYIETKPGVAGASLLVSPERLTLLDIFHAVESVEGNQLFNFHKNTDTNCSVGMNIESILLPKLSNAQKVMEHELASVTLAQIVEQIRTEANIK
ncbi:Rrf2 family transcriptional regulator [Paenibacillus xylanexedens]|uniref:Rrf2 family transcriptional regulator n=1 Tax=Paenibacillus xylanexedens TaxID=528191 RepID=UPI001F3AAF35|nr:Rrf2 family transcriptional regulator [Paenibacillus xylanexedens]MCF7754101.1 Rrf2 family transcriptional regulator [Paenibacillus xylanexedens]